MKYWRSGILCGLIVCLGCGTLTHTRTNRPSFVNPPVGRPIAPPVPDLSPGNSTIEPSAPSQNGPTFDPSAKKTNSTRISTFRLDSESARLNPPPRKGYIELPPPADAK